MKISVISVLYDQKLTAGNTWNTLILPALRDPAGKAAELQVILADNSDDDRIREVNRRTAEEYGAVYLDMQGNRGLPAAYNRAIREVITGNTERVPSAVSRNAEKIPSVIPGSRDDGWIVAADQDTCFPDTYLQVLEETAGQTACDVLAPVVKAGQKLLSPCRRKGSRFVPCTSETPGEEELQEAFFINAGLAFREKLFEDPEIRYDEQLFLDFVDFDLICRLRTRNREKVRFGQLPGIVLQQQFSGTEQRTPEQDLERFRHFVHDGRLFYERWYGKGTAANAVRSRAIRLAAKHRDSRFLKELR